MARSFRHPRRLLTSLLVIWMFDTLPSPAVWAAQAFQESAGQVVMQAENYDNKIPRNGQDWVKETSQSGYSGSGYMTALPNSGTNQNTGYVTASPELVYNVQFTTTGTYYVWLRGLGTTGNDDSIHAGIDGTGPASADRISGFGTSWIWSRSTMDTAVATLSISSPGPHTIHLWMREDGMKVDKILLRTSSSSTAPSGTGPAESPRVTVDVTPPSVSVTSPVTGATVSGTITVSATASDDVGIVGVQFKLDGATLGAEDMTNPYGVSWDTTTATNGSHTLTAVARDASGKNTTSSPISVTVNNVPSDTTPPAGSVTINNGAAATKNLTVTLTLSATDASGVAQMQISNDGTTYSTPEAYATSKNWTLSSGDGTKTVYVKFKDTAGNWMTTPATDTITLDTTPPSMSFISPQDGDTLSAPAP